MAQRQYGLPAVETDCLAEQEPSDHLCQQHEMTLDAERAVLTQEADQLSMEPGVENHWVFIWSDIPTVSWLPAHPMT
jgi:hypothetical protein